MKRGQDESWQAEAAGVGQWSHQRKQPGDAGVATSRLSLPRICRSCVAETTTLSEYLSWQCQDPESLMEGWRMERALCKE